MSKTPEITKDLRKAIEKAIQQEYGWKSTEYELEYIAEWDNSRVPLIVALPKMRTPYSPMYIIGPNNQVWSKKDKATFEKILKHFFPQISPADTKQFIQLFLWFCYIERPHGEFYIGNLEEKMPKGKIPKTKAEPRYRQGKGTFIFEFYVYDYELLQLSEIKLKITLTGSGNHSFSVEGTTFKKENSHISQ